MRGRVTALIAGIVLFSLAFRSDVLHDFPVPSHKKNMLFYVQRSINKNTIVYEVNLAANGEINTEQPIKIYWINYAGSGNEENLNYIQNKYAYGIEIKLIDQEKKSFSFNFVSYKKQKLFLMRNENSKKYHVYSNFGSNLLRVQRIYVHIEGGSFWFPKVKYVEVSGINVNNNEEIVEKIIP